MVFCFQLESDVEASQLGQASGTGRKKTSSMDAISSNSHKVPSNGSVLISLQELCDGDIHQPIKFVVYHADLLLGSIHSFKGFFKRPVT